MGRHKGLKIPRLNGHAGSSPAPGTNLFFAYPLIFYLFVVNAIFGARAISLLPAIMWPLTEPRTGASRNLVLPPITRSRDGFEARYLDYDWSLNGAPVR